ncbi:hypothetical protein Pelo_16968 [Pelomyxa schiedti]|nr:hypothetical protein Pelo_16968 [Pelomyxa schiedti]
MAATTECNEKPLLVQERGLVEALGLNVGKRVFRNVSDNHARKYILPVDKNHKTQSVNGFVFGGYTAQDWDGSLSSYVADTTGTNFLFSWKRPGTSFVEGLVKFPIVPSPEKAKATYSRYDHGPCFGAGNDLWIAHNCFSSPSASSILLSSYGLPHPVPQEFDTIRDTLDVDSWLGGAPKFQLTEYEVYIVMS